MLKCRKYRSSIFRAFLNGIFLTGKKSDMKSSLTLLYKICLIAGFMACNPSTPKEGPDKKFLDPSSVDSTVKPGDNFYLYVNGKWIKNHEIPVSQNGIGGFTDLYYSTQDTLHKILDSLSGLKLVSGTIAQKVGDFYASGMDSLTINRRGFEPLKPWLEKISAIRDAAGVMNYAAGAQEMISILYAAGVGPGRQKQQQKCCPVFPGRPGSSKQG